jgi:NADP-dependent 3-hydroxy acid dehydrogenase YdfG
MPDKGSVYVLSGATSDIGRAESVLYALSLPATAEVVDLTIRPAIKSY